MRKLMTLGLVAVIGGAAGIYLDRTGAVPGWDPVRPIAQTEPGPGGPPVVWVAGSIERATATEVVLRQGPARLALRRLAGGATEVFGREGGRWEARIGPGALPIGERVCVESLLDGSALVALRVFLGARGCGPA